jgi:hypothetical protein
MLTGGGLRGSIPKTAKITWTSLLILFTVIEQGEDKRRIGEDWRDPESPKSLDPVPGLDSMHMDPKRWPLLHEFCRPSVKNMK